VRFTGTKSKIACHPPMKYSLGQIPNPILAIYFYLYSCSYLSVSLSPLNSFPNFFCSDNNSWVQFSSKSGFGAC
jgi:hypothetical protein